MFLPRITNSSRIRSTEIQLLINLMTKIFTVKPIGQIYHYFKPILQQKKIKGISKCKIAM